MSLRLDKDTIEILSKEEVGIRTTIKKGDYTQFLSTELISSLNKENRLLSSSHFSQIHFTSRNNEYLTKHHRLTSLFSFEDKLVSLYKSYVIIRIDVYPDNNHLSVNDKTYYSFIRLFRKDLEHSPYRDLILGYIGNIEINALGKWHLHFTLFLNSNRYTQLSTIESNILYNQDLLSLKKYINLLLNRMDNDLRYALIYLFDMSISNSNTPLLIISDTDIKMRNCSRYWLGYNCKGKNTNDRLLTKKIYRNRRMTVKLSDTWYMGIDQLITLEYKDILKSINPTLPLLVNRLENVFSLESFIANKYKEYIILPVTLTETTLPIDIGDYIDMMGQFVDVRNTIRYISNTLLGYSYAYRLENNKWVMYWYLFFMVGDNIPIYIDTIITHFKSWIRRRKSPVSLVTVDVKQQYTTDSIIRIDDYNERNRVRIMIAGLAYTTTETIDYTSNYANMRLYGSYRLPS